jgi:hypothetical protein
MCGSTSGRGRRIVAENRSLRMLLWIGFQSWSRKAASFHWFLSCSLYWSRRILWRFVSYAGKDADFKLYEDSGDVYAYEHGAQATIHLHWDDHRNVLPLGDRSGSFHGMQMKHTFQIVLVKPGKGSWTRLRRGTQSQGKLPGAPDAGQPAHEQLTDQNTGTICDAVVPESTVK